MARCDRCMLVASACICDVVPRLANRTRVVIVRHAAELHRSSNSARLAELALANCELVTYGSATRDAPSPGELALPVPASGAMLLFPVGATCTRPPQPPPTHLVVLDGSWSQARRMYRKLGALRGMPCLVLPPPVQMPARLRKAPAPGQVSTIEAIAEALRLLEGEPMAAPLEALFAEVVERMRRAGRNVGLPPRTP